MVAELADQADDVVDAYMTLLVHAGIAAADLICCARLGEHALGTDHGEAVALLKQAAGAKTSGHLSTLLAVKTKAGYSHTNASSNDRTKTERAAAALLKVAREI